MAFNLKKRNKTALAPIPELGDVAYNSDNPLRSSWEIAAAKMLPQYQAQDPSIMDINSAMAKLKKTPEDVVNEASAINSETIQKQEEVLDIQNNIKNQLQSTGKLFNLKIAKNKKAQFEAPPQSSPDSFVDPELMGDQLEEQNNMMSIPQPPFSKIEDFRKWADLTEMSQVLQSIASPEGDDLKEAMEQYFASDDEGTKGQIAAQIFSDSSFLLRKEQGVMAIPKSFGEVDNIIKKIAKNITKKNKNKVFNFKKIAQHKTIDNAILWGPGQTRIDPFLHQPVSDWHIVERNKGFGLVVDDIWNIDYETIWRENIMDKYSRPYKDANGNWVGGYIQKRFEVDKNIPDENNMQLKPGQLRKPILPEYGNTESRLQAARAAGKIEGANDKSQPFNWKEASKKKS